MANVLFYKCMTPMYLKGKTVQVDTQGSDDTELEIKSDSQDYEEVLRQKILAMNTLVPADRYADITVAINVCCEGPPPEVFDPLSIMISDGRDTIGIQLQDPTNYHVYGPYRGIAGMDGHLLSNISLLTSTEQDRSRDFQAHDLQRWPQTFHIVLKPSSTWGLCYSACHGGISLSYGFPRKLRLDDGLELVLFRGKSTEEYILNMIEVTVTRDHADIP